MFVRGVHFLLLAFSFLAIAGRSAHADLITVTYNVTIDERCTADGCASFATEFPLAVTLDTRITFRQVSPNRDLRAYGPPTFSAIPLPRPSANPNARASVITLDAGVLFAAPDSWRRLAVAEETYRLIDDDVEFVWLLDISAVIDTNSPPALSPNSFARSLGEGRFHYGFFGRDLFNEIRSVLIRPHSVVRSH